MASETQVILRAVLYQAKMARDLEAAIRAIENMCDKGIVSAVNEI